MFNISKIQNESNSQHKWCNIQSPKYCVQYFKDTKWKQFTTPNVLTFQINILCSIFQRYKMKAIHNRFSERNKYLITVFNISKIQNESNSQRWDEKDWTSSNCVQYFKDTKWKQFTTRLRYLHLHLRLCSIFQRYKMKAIHNKELPDVLEYATVFNISKIQNESNSQLPRAAIEGGSDCVQYFKDTKWKQFTTYLEISLSVSALCSIFQRYKMKAIHNRRKVFPFFFYTVFNISKIQNESNSQLIWLGLLSLSHCVQYFKDTKWKQFTTKKLRRTILLLLCSIFQRYKMKAIHNNVLNRYAILITVFNISKIQNESNSQHIHSYHWWKWNCVQYFKDTKWKQFTTMHSNKCI